MASNNSKSRKEVRREEAVIRGKNLRSPAAQLAHLDRKFGPGLGAKKERAKIAKKLAKE